MTSFTNKKELRFVITLGNGTFAGSSNNQITLQGFRAIVDIDKAGGVQMSTLRAQVFGVSQSDINSVTTLQWKPGDFIKNTVQVYAIDGNSETLVFNGNIVNAWGNYQNMPNVFLMIQAQAALTALTNPVAPRSYQGSIDVPTAMSQIAASIGLNFENNGVNVPPLSNQYLPNTALEQAKALAKAAGIDLYIDDLVLAITPANRPRSKPVPIISSQTGMKGYPTFDGVGVNFEVLFNPSIVFGGSIQIVTSIPKAAGVWVVTSIAHRLESEKPGGSWFSTVRGNHSGLAVTA